MTNNKAIDQLNDFLESLVQKDKKTKDPSDAFVQFTENVLTHTFTEHTKTQSKSIIGGWFHPDRLSIQSISTYLVSGVAIAGLVLAFIWNTPQQSMSEEEGYALFHTQIDKELAYIDESLDQLEYIDVQNELQELDEFISRGEL